LDIVRGGGVERLPEPLLSSVSKSHLKIIYQGLVGTIIMHNGPGGWETRRLLILAIAIGDLQTVRFVYRAAISARLVEIRGDILAK
jgi:hypothetical protein